MAQGQTFQVTINTPPQTDGSKAIGANLAAPLAQEGAGDLNALSRDSGIVKAAARLATGFRQTTQVRFEVGHGGQAVRYDIPNLSGGEPSPGVVFHSPKIYIARQGETMTTWDQPPGYDLYDNPVMRFVMTGVPFSKESEASLHHGRTRFKSSPTMIRVVEWSKDAKGTLKMLSATESDHRLIAKLRASVSPDHRTGWFERIDNHGARAIRSDFRRIQDAPGAFDFAQAFPSGLTVQDYRGGRSEPLKYTWEGKLDGDHKSSPSESGTSRAGVAGAGIVLLLLGFGSLKGLKARRRVGSA